MLPSDLRPEIRWLASGFLLVFCSGFGQTYFIAIFAGELKSALAITDGQFGGMYTLATLASAATLVFAGRLADVVPIRWLGAGIILGLALAALAMASTPTAWLLLPIFFGLRFFGQGMLTHVAMTGMGRWFNRKRGRAVSIAALGFPAGEAMLPFVAVTLIGIFGWRGAWFAASAALVILALPAIVALLARERVPAPAPSLPHREEEPDGEAHTSRTEWTRGEVLRSPTFWVLMPGVLAQPFVQTGVFFNQVAIMAEKGWPLSWLAASFPLLAAVSVAASLGSGTLVDRIGTHRLLPAFLLPLGVAIVLLVFAPGPWALPVMMAMIGLTAGSSATIQGALWAELYGTRHLGAIRSLATAATVFASAFSPGLIGLLLDFGVALSAQLLAMAAYCFAAALLMLVVARRIEAARGFSGAPAAPPATP